MGQEADSENKKATLNSQSHQMLLTGNKGHVAGSAGTSKAYKQAAAVYQN